MESRSPPPPGGAVPSARQDRQRRPCRAPPASRPVRPGPPPSDSPLSELASRARGPLATAVAST
eukprot:6429138-Pyramimonas_sp.AAC.1